MCETSECVYISLAVDTTERHVHCLFLEEFSDILVSVAVATLIGQIQQNYSVAHV
jgi:hypothetical protein